MNPLSVDILPASQSAVDVYDANGNYAVELALVPQGQKGDPGTGINIVLSFGASKTVADLPLNGLIPKDWDSVGNPSVDVQFSSPMGVIFNLGDPLDMDHGHVFLYQGDIVSSGWVDVGQIGHDGKDGVNGKDGVSPVVGMAGDQITINGAIASPHLTGQKGQDGVTPVVTMSGDQLVINGTVQPTHLSGKDGANGTNGKDGATPTVYMQGDQLVINGVLQPTHLTGAPGKDGKDGGGSAKLVKMIGAGFYVPTVEDVNTLLLNEAGSGNESVVYLSTTDDIAIPVGAEIELVDENFNGQVDTYFKAQGNAVVHAPKGAGCANAWSPIRAIKVNDKEWVVYGDTAEPFKPLAPTTPAVLKTVNQNDGASFSISWTKSPDVLSKQTVQMFHAGTSTLVSEYDVSATATSIAEFAPNVTAVGSVTWRDWDFRVVSYGLEGTSPGISNIVKQQAGVPTVAVKTHSCTTYSGSQTKDRKTFVEFFSNWSNIVQDPADAKAQGVTGYDAIVFDPDTEYYSNPITFPYYEAPPNNRGGVDTSISSVSLVPNGNFGLILSLRNKWGAGVQSAPFMGIIRPRVQPFTVPTAGYGIMSLLRKDLGIYDITYNPEPGETPINRVVLTGQYKDYPVWFLEWKGNFEGTNAVDFDVSKVTDYGGWTPKVGDVFKANITLYNTEGSIGTNWCDCEVVQI